MKVRKLLRFGGGVECKDKDGVVYSEEGSVVDIDDDEINMFDGKEGWSVKREEIVSVVPF